MKVTHNLRMDLARCSCTQIVNAVQGESNARELVVSLYDNGVAWEVPEGVTAAVAFKKPDGLCGLYDQLPNGDAATAISGSTVTAILAPQALTVPGEVMASIVFFDADLDRLATFPFRIRVAADPAGGQHVSNEYYNYTTLEEINEAVDAALAALEADKQAFLDAAEEALALVHDTATGDAPAIVCEATGEVVAVADASGRPLHGLTLYGKTTQDGTPTPDAPVELVTAGASGAINTVVAGKNLISPESVDIPYNSRIQIHAHKTTGGILLPVGTYTLSCNATCSGIYVHEYSSEEMLFAKYSTSFMMFTLTEPKLVYLLFYNTTPFADGVENTLQLEIGETATEYEPYKGQTLTASTPNGLPGYPIGATIPAVIKAKEALMAGVWWNEEEQQYYISDTKDYACGVYVQRCKTIASYAGEDVSDNFISSTGELTTGATVIYPLTTPIETALSAEELAQYAALHSNKPNTTVYNDGGAGMKVEYVADTKLYIDQKIAAISAAVLNA